MDKEKIKEYFYQNLGITFWSSLLIFGGSVFVYYYAKIGYMPIFDLQSSLMVLGAASITAIFLIIIITSIFLLPGLIWREGWGNNTKYRSLWYFRQKNGRDKKVHFHLIFAFFVIPISAFWIIFFSAMKFGIWISFLVVVLLPVMWLGLKKFSRFNYKSVNKESLVYFLVTLTASIASFVPIVMLSENLNISSISKEYIVYFIAIIIATLNTVAAAKPKNIDNLKFFCILSIISIYILLVSFELAKPIVNKVMNIYKFGSIQAENIILKKPGCDIFSLQGGTLYLTKNEFCLIQNVEILSRLGDNYYISTNKANFEIPKIYVASWSVIDDRD